MSKQTYMVLRCDNGIAELQSFPEFDWCCCTIDSLCTFCVLCLLPVVYDQTASRAYLVRSCWTTLAALCVSFDTVVFQHMSSGPLAACLRKLLRPISRKPSCDCREKWVHSASLCGTCWPCSCGQPFVIQW